MSACSLGWSATKCPFNEGAPADAYLRARRAHAAYIGDQGRPGIVVIGAEAEYGDVMHEARHFGHDRRAGFPGQMPREDVLLSEIDAYAYELRNARRWGYSAEHVQEVHRLLALHREELRLLHSEYER